MLGCIRVRWAKQAVTLDGTNLDQHLQVTIKGATSGKGEVIIPAGDLVNMLKGTGRTDACTALLRGDLFTWQVGTRRGAFAVHLKGKDWPNLDQRGNEVWTKPRTVAGSWLEAVRQVLPAAAPDESRPVLSGLLWQGDKLVAADGFRLHLVTLPKPAKGFSHGLIIPAHGLQHLPKLDSTQPLRISLRLVRVLDADRQPTGELTAPQAIRISQGGVLFTCRLIEGQFPDYAKILPRCAGREPVPPRLASEMGGGRQAGVPRAHRAPHRRGARG